MKIFYSILHYQNISVTEKCVNLLLKQRGDFNIIIVDNCSPNNSGEKLRLLYGNFTNIKIIENKENVGFAKGNNLGFSYAKEMGADIIVVMNNDVLIEDINFGDKITTYMKENNINVCGPDILTPENLHQNPHLENSYSIDEIKTIISHNKKMIKILHTPILRNLFLLYRKHKRIELGVKSISEIKKNPVLHGSIIVYDSSYIKQEEFAFLPVTFMYGEECILYDYLMHKNYTTGICLSTTVTHLGGKSSNIGNNGIEKLLFKFENANRSWVINIKQQYRYIYG